MAIPPSFADDVLAFHGVKTWKDIFKYPRFNVVRSRHSICCGRTFIKSP